VIQLFVFYKFEINEQVDMMKIIASQDKDENFLIQLVKKYKIMKAEISETRKQKWTEPNFHELKVIVYFGKTIPKNILCFRKSNKTVYLLGL
jgi:hypothetical protein